LFDRDTLNLAESVLSACRSRQWHVATAESCTGGLVAAALTAIAGSSEVVERGFVTYSNQAKIELLGASPETIAEHGAISEQIALAMARGAVVRAGVDLAVSVTGIAGPGGGTPQKPVGIVHIAAASKDQTTLHLECHFGDIGRENVRLRSVEEALKLLLQIL